VRRHVRLLSSALSGTDPVAFTALVWDVACLDRAAAPGRAYVGAAAETQPRLTSGPQLECTEAFARAVVLCQCASICIEHGALL
jgi:hypothetical protein